jgi:peptide/nickel transport system substrate-binding protein
VQHSPRWVTKRPGQLIGASLLALGLVAAACGGDNSGTSPTTTSGGTATTASGATTTAGGTATTTATTAAATTTTAAKPVAGGKITVRVEAEVGNPWLPANMNCDTACQTRARTFYEPLMAIDKDGKPKPYLAQDVTHSADYQTWTVKLRPNITFTDGTPLNADAVIDNIERQRKSALVGPYIKDIAGETKVDDLTVNITLSRPWVSFDFALTSQAGFMASPTWMAAADADPTKATQPIGTGPFILTQYTAGDVTIVKKNPNYWRKGEGIPYLDEIDFKVVQDSLTAANALKSGQLDVLVDDNGQNIKTFRTDKSFNYTEQNQHGETAYVLLHAGQPDSPLGDQDVRCGLTAATDVKTIIEATQAGAFQQANGPFSPGQQGHLDSTGNQGYDPAKAKELIGKWSAAHGGQKPKVSIGATNDATTLQIAQLLQQWWNEAGADASIQQIEQSKYITTALLGDPSFQAFLWRNHAGFVFDNQYIWWNSVNAQPQGQVALNFGRVRDPVLDQLLDDAHTNPDLAAGTKDAEQANQEFAKQCWLIPEWWVAWGIVSKPAVQGIGTATFPGGTGTLYDGQSFPGQVWWQNVYVKS